MPISARSFAPAKTKAKAAAAPKERARGPKTQGAIETIESHTNDAPESAVQRRMVRLLLDKGYRVVRVNSGAFKAKGGFFRAYIIHGLFNQNGKEVYAGFPDLLAICSLEAYLRGVGAWSAAVAAAFEVAGIEAGLCNVAHLIEVKKAGGRLRAEQKTCIEYLSIYGIKTLPCLSWDDAERVAGALPDLRPHLHNDGMPAADALDGFKSPRQKRAAAAKAGFGKL